ncbi:MAG: zinc uptake protein ZrgA [Paracoccaceae bacterium]
MKRLNLALLACVTATPLLAQDPREADAHVHGVSTLEMAIEDGNVLINLVSPGMDLVGFEYEASTDADKDAVEAALRVLLTPENIVALPAAAQCRLAEVLAHLHAGAHDHEEDEDHDHADENGAEDHADHSEDAHAKDHAEEEAQTDQTSGAHSEFHVRYAFDCTHPEALTKLSLPFFQHFEKAQEIEAQFVTSSGAGAAEIRRESPALLLTQP